jgi:hypothetical protein
MFLEQPIEQNAAKGTFGRLLATTLEVIVVFILSELVGAGEFCVE